MKVRAKANGEVIDVSEEAATILLNAGIYEPVDTKVEPMGTDSMPGKPKRAK
jgi:hypothetical protein